MGVFRGTSYPNIFCMQIHLQNVLRLKCSFCKNFNVTDFILIQDKTVTSIKRKMAEESSNKVAESSQVKESEETVLEAGRKRSLGNEPTVEEEPPTKKGTISTVTGQGVFQKNLIPIPEQKPKVAKRKLCGMRRKSVLKCKWK